MSCRLSVTCTIGRIHFSLTVQGTTLTLGSPSTELRERHPQAKAQARGSPQITACKLESGGNSGVLDARLAVVSFGEAEQWVPRHTLGVESLLP